MAEQVGVFDQELETLSGALEDAATVSQALHHGLVYGGVSLTDANARSLVQLLEGLGIRADNLRRALLRLERRARSEMDRQQVRARFLPESVSKIVAELEERATRSPALARRRWLAKLIAALVEGELSAAEIMLRRPIVPEKNLQDAIPDLTRDLLDWRNAEVTAGQRMTDRLAEVCAEELALRRLGRAARDLQLVRARLALDTGDADRAVSLLQAGLPSITQDALLLAELAAARLAAGDQEGAREAASRAVELAPDRPDGYLHLGAVAEAQGALDDAVDLYRQGCVLLSVASLEYLGRGSTLLRVTGLLHRERARRLEELEYPRLSLEALDASLAAGVVGTARYPTAPVHQTRAHILERLGRPANEIAAEALTAGKQLLWNGDVSAAIPLLRKACDMDRLPEAGWFLADAMLAMSWPDGEPQPNQSETEAAEHTWRSWLETVGAPDRSLAWAYATGAILAEQHKFWEDNLDTFWRALLRIEKALALDASSALFWALCARYLRNLGLDALAGEAADRAYALDPDDMDSVAQQLMTLVDVGRYAEGLELLDRIPDAESDPWMLGMRGQILYNLGQHEDALTNLSRALEGEYNEGSYLELRCSVLIALDRVEEAVADLKELIKRDTGGGATGRLRRARALVVLGRTSEAGSELDAVVDDTLVKEAELGLTRTLVLLASGDIGEALRQAEDTRNQPLSERASEQIAKRWRDYLLLLQHEARLSPEALDTLRGIASIAPSPRTSEPTPDDDLRRGLEWVDNNPLSEAKTALLAIAARRSAAAANWTEAIKQYEALVATPFEPEAVIALGDVIGQALAAAVQHGDVSEALSLHDRLTRLGGSPYRSRALVMADALLAVGDVPAALETLEHAAVDVDDDWERFSTYQRLGEVAALAENGRLAVEALDTALLIASRLDDPLASAQTEARLGIAWSLLRNRGAAVQHLVHALALLKEAGALDPPYTLALELLGLIRRIPSRGAPEALSTAYEDATREVYGETSVYADLAQSIRVASSADTGLR